MSVQIDFRPSWHGRDAMNDNILLHIGCPKTGTTYLKRWFEAHPQLLFVHDGMADSNVPMISVSLLPKRL